MTWLTRAPRGTAPAAQVRMHEVPSRSPPVSDNDPLAVDVSHQFCERVRGPGRGVRGVVCTGGCRGRRCSAVGGRTVVRDCRILIALEATDVVPTAREARDALRLRHKGIDWHFPCRTAKVGPVARKDFRDQDEDTRAVADGGPLEVTRSRQRAPV